MKECNLSKKKIQTCVHIIKVLNIYRDIRKISDLKIFCFSVFKTLCD